PFSDKCNTSFEFGCYRFGVSNPLDINSYRPCINLSQIGDGVEDCYNAYDEKNTFTAESLIGDMWGFHAQCSNGHLIYAHACIPNTKGNCNNFLCSRFRDTYGSCTSEEDFICLNDSLCKKNIRCNGIFDCAHGEDEYWCPAGSYINQYDYRFDKESIITQRMAFRLPTSYPSIEILETNQSDKIESIHTLLYDGSFTIHSFQCNRGVTIIKLNQTKCLCPPAYYGRWCEFFTDRISIIAYLDQTTLLKTITNLTLKIKANFFFNDQIVDHHQFIIVPTIERVKKIKHRFYLLYSRSADMLAHKRDRYFNRTDIIDNHPYSVHFDLYTLKKNKNVEEIGSWHYPIYF
ncbi:unnamed protein product, partial [Rotaria magnacalcarata]